MLTCKPASHPTLYAELALVDKINGVTQQRVRQFNGRCSEVWPYGYGNRLPLRSVHEQTGELLHHHAFMTNHILTKKTVQPLLVSARTRWKIENENNTVLKNYGYPLEHNFGHGQP